MTKSDLMTIRDYVPDDRNLIISTFLLGLYYGDSWFSEIEKKTFMEHYNKVINYLIDSPKTSIKVACLKEDANTVLGYAMMSGPNLHWVFVKKNWRGIGIAKDLVPSSITTVTHLTKTGLSIIKKKALAFNPFII